MYQRVIFFQVVRSPPAAVSNLTIITHSVFALVMWNIPSDGHFPIENFVLSYKRHDDEEGEYGWNNTLSIDPGETSKTVYGLRPNTTYYFKIYARNSLGDGLDVSKSAVTKFNTSEIDEAKQLKANGETNANKSNEEDEDEETSSYMRCVCATHLSKMRES